MPCRGGFVVVVPLVPYAVSGMPNPPAGAKAPPAYILKLPAVKQRQFCEVWNRAHQACMDKGRPAPVCEQSAFMQANGVVHASDWEAAGLALEDEALGITLAERTTNKPWDGSAARFGSTEAYCKSCLWNDNTGPPATWTQDKCHLPVREPDGTVNLNALRNASGAHGIMAVKGSPEGKAKAQRMLDAMKQMHGIGLADEPDYAALADAFTVCSLRLADGASLPEWQQIHRIGDWAVPHATGGKIQLTRQMGDQIIDNFNRHVVRQRIPLLLSHDGPSGGEFEELRWGSQGDGLPGRAAPDGTGAILFGRVRYNEFGRAELGARKHLYISPGYTTAYVDKESGKPYGAALLHVATVNNPYLRLQSVHGDPPLPIAASDAVLVLSDGLAPYQEAPVAENTTPAAINLADKVSALELQLAEERRQREASDKRAEDQRVALHLKDCEAFLSDLEHKGLPTAVAKVARQGLPLLREDQAPVIRLGDTAEPSENVFQWVKRLLTTVSTMPLGSVTYAGGIQPPATGTDEQQLTDAIDKRVERFLADAYGTRVANGTNGTK